MSQLLDTLANIADGVCGIDRTQRIVLWNAAAEHLMGYRKDEVYGMPCCTVFQGQARPGCHVCEPGCEIMTAAMQGRTIPSYNLLSQTKHGKTILLNVTVIVLPPTESPLVTIHLFRDITHQLQYETYVEHVLRAASRLPPPTNDLTPQPRCPHLAAVLLDGARAESPRALG